MADEIEKKTSLILYRQKFAKFFIFIAFFNPLFPKF